MVIDGTRSARGPCSKWGPRAWPFPARPAAVEYLERLTNERGLSPHTVAAYRRDLDQFLTFCERLEIVSLPEIDRRTVRRFLAQLSTVRYARRSIARKLSSVRAFLADEARRGSIETNPAVGVQQPKKPGTLPKAIPARGIAEALDRIDDSDAVGATEISPCSRSSTEPACGCRRLSRSTPAHVRDRDFLRVRGKGDRERIVPIGRPATRALASYLKHGRPALATERAGDSLWVGVRGGAA